jgi:hypothetical protein
MKKLKILLFIDHIGFYLMYRSYLRKQLSKDSQALAGNIFHQSTFDATGLRKNNIYPPTDLSKVLDSLSTHFKTLTPPDLDQAIPIVETENYTRSDSFFTFDRKCTVGAPVHGELVKKVCADLTGNYEPSDKDLKISIVAKVDVTWQEPFTTQPGLKFKTPRGEVTLQKSMESREHPETSVVYYPSWGHYISMRCQSEEYGRARCDWYVPDSPVSTLSIIEIKSLMEKSQDCEYFNLGLFVIPEFDIKTNENILANKEFAESEIGRVLTTNPYLQVDLFNIKCTQYCNTKGAGGSFDIDVGASRGLEDEPVYRDIIIDRPYFQEILIDNEPVLCGYICDPEPEVTPAAAVSIEHIELTQLRALLAKAEADLAAVQKQQVKIMTGLQTVSCHQNYVTACTYNMQQRFFCDMCKQHMDQVSVIDGSIVGYSSVQENFDMCVHCFERYRIKELPTVRQVIQRFGRKL